MEKIELTDQELIKVFEDWENDFRANPESFLSQEDCAKMEVATLSERCTITFKAYLKQRQQ